jgi:hypothetical protein
MDWREIFPEATTEDIMEEVEKWWDLDIPLPIPKFSPLCVCGGLTWHGRLWLFWDRTGGGALEHRIAHRCDMSMKCQRCGQVVIWGVPLPRNWVNFWGPRLDVQIDFRVAKRIYETWELKKEEGLDSTGWRREPAVAESAD